MAGVLGDLIVRVGASIEGFETGMQSVSKRLSASTKEITSVSAGFSRLGSTLTGIGTTITGAITLPIAAAAGASTKFAADFDLAMRQVTSLLGETAKPKFDALSKSTIDLAKNLGIDAVGAANALYEAISAGIPEENALDFVRVASVSAIAGLTDTKIAVNALTTMLAAYSMETSKAKELSDAMFQAVNIGKFQFADLATAIGPAAQMASTLGVSYQELLAATATLSISAGSANVAVTQVESAMRSLLNPTKEMQKALGEIGVQSGSAAIQAFGFEGTLQRLRETTGNSAEAFNALFGRIEGATGAMGLTGDKAKSAADDLNTMMHASDGLGASMVAYNEINKSTSRQFEILTNNLKTTAIELGVALLPSVNRLLEACKPLIGHIQSLVEWFTNLSPVTQKTIIAFTGIAAAIGPLLIVMGQLSSAVGTAASAFKLMTTLFSGVLVPVVASVIGAVSNIAAAISGNLIGALSSGELMLLRFGQAAALAGAAFAGWELGKWIDANIIAKMPALASFLDTLVSPIGDAIAKWSGATKQAEDAQASLLLQVERLEHSLKLAGVTVDRGGLSLEDYSEKLRKLAIEHAPKATSATSATSSAQTELATAIANATGKTKENSAALTAMAAATKQAQQEAALHKSKLLDLSLQTAAARRDTQSFLETVQAETREWRDLDAVMSKSSNIVIPKLSDNIEELSRKSAELTSGIGNLSGAFDAMGIRTSSSLQKAAESAAREFDAIKSSGVATPYEIEQAWVKYLEAQKAAALSSGEIWTKENERMLQAHRDTLDAMEGRTKSSADAQRGLWSSIGQQVSTVFTDLSKSLNDVIWSSRGIGDIFASVFEEIGKGITRLVIEEFEGKLIKCLKDMISGDGIIASVKRAFEDLFGGISSGLGSVFGSMPGAGATAGAGGGGATGGAGSAGGGAGGGIGGIFTAIGSIGSMVSGIVGLFQGSKQNDILRLIELNTRRSGIFLGETLDGGIEGHTRYIQAALEFSGPIATLLDQIKWGLIDGLFDISVKLGLIQPDVSAVLAEAKSMNARSAANVVININGASDPTAIAAEVSRQLRLQFVT